MFSSTYFFRKEKRTAFLNGVYNTQKGELYATYSKMCGINIFMTNDKTTQKKKLRNLYKFNK